MSPDLVPTVDVPTTRPDDVGAMTNTAATNQRGHPQDTPIRAVLFDLSGTLLDEQYLHHGLVHLAAALHERWAIDPTVTRTGFMVAFRAVSQECADQPFYLMRDMICRALERLIAELRSLADTQRAPSPRAAVLDGSDSDRHTDRRGDRDADTAARRRHPHRNRQLRRQHRVRGAAQTDRTCRIDRRRGLLGDGPLVQATPRHLPPGPPRGRRRSNRSDVRRRHRRHRHRRRQPHRHAHRPAIRRRVHARRRPQRRPRVATRPPHRQPPRRRRHRHHDEPDDSATKRQEERVLDDEPRSGSASGRSRRTEWKSMATT